MLRLRDARTGELRTVPSTARTPIVRVHVRGGSLRGLLVADLIRRHVSVAYDLRVVQTTTSPHPDAEALNIHPFETTEAPESADVRIDSGRSGPGVADIGCDLHVATVSVEADPHSGDPLAMRLLLLQSHYREELVVGAAELAAAAEALRNWRVAVATWARAPGAPMAAEQVRGIAAALDDDLATPIAFQVLGDLEADDSIVSGAKFETFAYVDRILGLDLARDVGR